MINKTLYESYLSTPEKRDQTARTVGGGLESFTESVFNLATSIAAETPLPPMNTAFLSEENQQLLLDAQISQDPNLQTEEQRIAQEKSKLETKQNAQYFLQDLYEATLGEQNVEMQQRGDVMSPTIKRPDSFGANLAREGISLGAALLSVKKITNPVKTFKDIKKIPERLGRIKARSKKAGEGFLKAEVVGQLAIDPMQANLASIAGEFISDTDDSWLSDIETYLLNPLKYEQGDTELEARLKMGADSLLLGPLLYGGLGFGKGVVKGTFGAGKFVIKNGKKIPLPKINVPDAFLQSLKDVREGGEEAVSDFLNIVKTKYKKNLTGNKLKAALKERRRRAEERGDVPKGTADYDALETGGLGKLILDINTRYSENTWLRKLAEGMRGFSPRQGVSVALHESFLRQLGLKDEAFATITHISRNIDREVNNLSDGLFSGITGKRGVIGKEARKRRENIMQRVDRILYTDFRFPAIKTSKGFQPPVKQKEAFARQLKLLPEELREPVKRLRMYRDALSEALARNPAIKPEEAAKILDQLGFYVKKSYKLREEGKWFPSAPLEKAARIDIRTQFLKYTKDGKEVRKRLTDRKRKNETFQEYEARVNAAEVDVENAVTNVIKQLLKGGKDTDYFTLMGTKGSQTNKDLAKQLKERMKMPKSVEEFLGRIDEPLGKFEISAAETARTLGDLQFYKEAHNLGRGIYIFKTGKTAPQGFNVQIKEGHGELSGMYTSDSYARFLQNINETSLFLGQGKMAKIMRTLSIYKAGTHFSKTVFSIGTQMVNVVGAVGSALANGNNIFTKDFIQGLQVVGKKGAATGDLKYQEMIEEGAKYGLWGKNILASEFTQGIKEFTKGRTGKSAMYLDKIYKGIGAKRVVDTATDVYRGGDEFVKWGMWKQETKFFDKINDALPSNSKFDKYRIADTKQEAANTVNAVVQNYEFLPRNLKFVRGIPFVSTFFSFSAESIRMLINSVRKVGQEIKLGHQMRRDGAEEAGNLMITRGTRRGASLTVMGGVTYGGWVSDLKDEPREQESKKLYSSTAAPNFYGGLQNFSVRVNEDDVPVFTPTDRINPYNVSKNILTAAMQQIHSNDPLKYNMDEDLASVLRDAILKEAETLTGESLLKDGVGTYFSFKENGQGYEFYGESSKPVLMKNPYDPTHVFDRSGSHMENITNMKNLHLLLARIADVYELGTATTILRYDENVKMLEDTKNQDSVTGKPINQYGSQIDFANERIGLFTSILAVTANNDHWENLYTQGANTFLSQRRDLKSRLSRAITEGYTPEDFTKVALEVNQQYYKIYRQFAKLTYTVNWHGINYKGLKLDGNDILRRNTSFSKDEAMAMGYVGTSTLTEKEGKKYGDIYNNKGIEYFVPLELTDADLQAFIDAEFKNTKYNSQEEGLAVYHEVKNKIYKELASLPVYVHQNDEEALKEADNYKRDPFKDLRKRYLKFDGGKVDKENPVPNAAAEPSERVNPYTGEPYEAEMERLGLLAGGFLRVIGKEALKKGVKETTTQQKAVDAIVSNMTGKKPTIIEAGKAQKELDDILGPMGAVYNPASAQKTQIATTGGTYQKASQIMKDYQKITALDYGSGMQVNQAKTSLKADTFEPYPKIDKADKYGTPDFVKSEDINKKYDFITNFSVLNVLPKAGRDKAVLNIGKLLEDDGIAVITARSKNDVVTTQTKKNAEQIISDSELITKKGTYQKGFTKEELQKYLSTTLGKDFEVINLPPKYKISGIGAIIRKKTLKNNKRQEMKKGGTARNYRQEYDRYQSKPDQLLNRASRNAARNKLKQEGRVAKGDGKDVDHKDGNPRNNSPSNLNVKKKENNRSFSRRVAARNGGLLETEIERLGFTEGSVVFDPEGDGYDYVTAEEYGLTADKTGHYPSRVSETGQLLKGKNHPTFHLTRKEEDRLGNIIFKGENGYYYSLSEDEIETLKTRKAKRDGGLMVSIGVTPVSEKQISKLTKSLKKRKAKKDGGAAKIELTHDQKQYIAFYNMAVKAGNAFPEIVASQASLESSHGKSELATKYNNPLGIKVLRKAEVNAGQPSVRMKTREVIDGKEIVSEEPFRVYDNIENSFVGYKEKVAHPRYDSIRKATNKEEYAQAIQNSGYASDPEYANKIVGIADRYAPLIK